MLGFFWCSFKSIAVVKKQRAVKKKHIAAGKINIFRKNGGVYIAGVNNSYFGISFNKIGDKRASEGIPKDNKALSVLLIRICDFKDGNGTGKKKFIRIFAGKLVKVVNFAGGIRFGIINGASVYCGTFNIIQLFRRQGQGGLTLIHSVKIISSCTYSIVIFKLKAQCCGNFLCGGCDFFLTPMGVGLIIAIRR